MIGIIILMLTITITSTLEPKKEESTDEEIKKILAKYIENIPDLKPKYILNNALHNVISKYYKKKINTFPLYKVSLKIDRTPVKIPWTLGGPSSNDTNSGQKYTFVKVKKQKLQKNETSA